MWGGSSGSSSTAPKSDASEDGTSPAAGRDGKSALSADKSVSAAGAAAGGANGSSAASGASAVAAAVAGGAHSADSESLIADSKAEEVVESLQHGSAGAHAVVASTIEGKGAAVDVGAIEVGGGKDEDQGWPIAIAAGIAFVGAAALAFFAWYRNRPGRQ